ncbi:MAG: hypothetical protein ABIK65_09165 [Candidatus Eisenbacteria bacterium]
MRSIPVLIALFATFSPGFAGELPYGGVGGSGESVFQYPSRGMLGILDPAKLSVSHEMSYFYSTGSGSVPGGGLGLYQNRLTYQVADPLRITLHLGYQFASPVGSTYGGDQSANAFLPGLSISYRPTENTLVRFDYRQLPGAYSAYRPWSLREPYPVD